MNEGIPRSVFEPRSWEWLHYPRGIPHTPKKNFGGEGVYLKKLRCFPPVALHITHHSTVYNQAVSTVSNLHTGADVTIFLYKMSLETRRTSPSPSFSDPCLVYMAEGDSFQ
jgi:hypothetical protein